MIFEPFRVRKQTQRVARLVALEFSLVNAVVEESAVGTAAYMEPMYGKRRFAHALLPNESCGKGFPRVDAVVVDHAVDDLPAADQPDEESEQDQQGQFAREGNEMPLPAHLLPHYSIPRTCFSQAQAERSVSSRGRSAFQPSSLLARCVSAQTAFTSPARRPTIL